MKKIIVILTAVLMMPLNASADDFPTMESVRYVLDCMFELGGQTEENLYACSCRHDYIASHISFDEYEQATFFQRYDQMPGKRGGLVRDNEEAPQLKKHLNEVKTEAAANCPVVKHIELNQEKKVIEK